MPTANELMTVANDLGVKGFKRMTKAQLAEAIDNVKREQHAAEVKAQAADEATKLEAAALEFDKNDAELQANFDALVTFLNGLVEAEQKHVDKFMADAKESGVRHATKWHGDKAELAEAKLHELHQLLRFAGRFQAGEMSFDKWMDMFNDGLEHSEQRVLDCVARGEFDAGFDRFQLSGEAFAVKVRKHVVNNFGSDNLRWMF
jgi:hypothetical protein